ncbi:Lrp/AsnC family transcriptional regulator [Gulosibacter molinativorax]|uniref:Lrp/AsnC family transcriptional regulator n=1 Tax=Gulosibacter molinativorax TaxID=256821 RepID=A0ABT7C985_9MICO|nr:Lrp/AsnC family transcriptional regulator [Gulosibacter molinativorax]MDJ1371655.1 Lrp/AsnC family transcriptional regulator [Gulosibacter molinativorax]QUY61000.1 Hypotetical protein [Gulosibacter molinativorax]
MSRFRVDIDEPLISALQTEPRASVLSLARTIGFPRALISTRLQALLDEEFIRIVSVVHPQLTGLTLLAHVSVSTDDIVGPVAEFAARIPETVFVASVAGEHDLIIEMRVRDRDHLRAVLTQIRIRPDVANTDTLVFAQVYKGYFEHDALTPIHLDALDQRLLHELETDGRKSWQELAEVVGLSPSAVRTRVRRMLEAGAAQIVLLRERDSQGSAITCGVGLSLRDSAAVVLPRLSDEPFVEFAVSTIGRYDALLTLRAVTPRALHEAIESVRAHPEIIGLELWAHLHTIKENFARRID